MFRALTFFLPFNIQGGRVDSYCGLRFSGSSVAFEVSVCVCCAVCTWGGIWDMGWNLGYGIFGDVMDARTALNGVGAIKL